MNYCEVCEFEETCPLANAIRFCKDCADFDGCNILETCKGGHYIECDNGFEEKEEVDSL